MRLKALSAATTPLSPQLTHEQLENVKYNRQPTRARVGREHVKHVRAEVEGQRKEEKLQERQRRHTPPQIAIQVQCWPCHRD